MQLIAVNIICAQHDIHSFISSFDSPQPRPPRIQPLLRLPSLQASLPLQLLLIEPLPALPLEKRLPLIPPIPSLLLVALLILSVEYTLSLAIP